MFDCPVLSTLAQPGCVVKVASCDRLMIKQKDKSQPHGPLFSRQALKGNWQGNHKFECESMRVKHYNSRKVVVNLRNNQSLQEHFFDRSRSKYKNEKQVPIVHVASFQPPGVD